MKKLGLLLMLLLAMTIGNHHVYAQSVTITLMPGWNWISVPLMDTLDFQTAMGTVTPVDGDIIKSHWGSAAYSNGQWRGTISQFYPGYGYHYKSNRTMPVFLTFNAQPPAPQVIVTTAEPTDITANSATCGGNVASSDGNYVFLMGRGICWSTHQDPTLNDNFTEMGNGMGGFTALMTGLNVSTTYYVRAYVVTSNGTTYGEQKTFITRDGIPSLTTAEVTNIGYCSAISGGTITDDGGLDISACGVCWNTSSNPTVANFHTIDSIGMDNFSSTIFGLNRNTTYYVRAYATNSCTTVYGNEVVFTTLSDAPIGAIDGMFSVNDSTQVFFSQGNLQYQPSTNTWRFANNSWDLIIRPEDMTMYLAQYMGGYYFADVTSRYKPNYSGWIDLFGWGTSGYNHGAVCYQPWNTNQNNSEYYAYGNYSYNLYDQSGQADWGYNPIDNGSNITNQWRTLTQSEWDYVFNMRCTTSGIRYAKANVNGVNGVIILPDDWSNSTYSLSNTNSGSASYNSNTLTTSTNSGSASYNSNTLTTSQWTFIEQAGAVFLPAAGYRLGTSVRVAGSGGNYWSASYNNDDNAGYMCFGSGNLNTNNNGRCHGFSVRLVRNVE